VRQDPRLGLQSVRGEKPAWVDGALAWTPPKLPGKLATFASKRNSSKGSTRS
jgi:hypothetical protein